MKAHKFYPYDIKLPHVLIENDCDQELEFVAERRELCVGN